VCENGGTDLNVVWDVELGGSKEACNSIRWGAHWRHLANTLNRTCAAAMRCGLVMAALCNRAVHYIFVMWFLLSFFFLSSLFFFLFFVA